MAMGNTAYDFFTQAEKDSIKKAIADAEYMTSGEIRIHIENTCKGDVLDRAATLFEKLGMVKTKQRNGVLFYIAVKSHKFAILGDAGINEKVPENFWAAIKENMGGHFSQGQYCTGLSEGIVQAGVQLKKWFPRQTDDANELPDDISTGKD